MFAWLFRVWGQQLAIPGISFLLCAQRLTSVIFWGPCNDEEWNSDLLPAKLVLQFFETLPWPNNQCFVRKKNLGVSNSELGWAPGRNLRTQSLQSSLLWNYCPLKCLCLQPSPQHSSRKKKDGGRLRHPVHVCSIEDFLGSLTSSLIPHMASHTCLDTEEPGKTGL